MRHHFEVDDMSSGYVQLVEDLIAEGRRRSPRGQGTYEIPNATIVLSDPAKSHPVGIGRRYGRGIAAAESLALVGGVSDPEAMISAGPNFKRFLDGGALHGAYGPRIRGQLPNVVQRLRDDRDTRQAYLQVWDARYDQAGWVPKDLPCTLGFGFAIYDDRLEMTATMRSNDVWYGVAHDFPMFTALQLTVADALGLEAGPYTHQAYSLHLYERDIEAAEEIGIRLDEYKEEILRTHGGGFRTFGSIENGAQRARDILAGKGVEEPSSSEAWYINAIADHVQARGAKAGAGMDRDKV